MHSQSTNIRSPLVSHGQLSMGRKSDRLLVRRGKMQKHVNPPWIFPVSLTCCHKMSYLETLKQKLLRNLVWFSVLASPCFIWNYIDLSYVHANMWESRPYDSCLKHICWKSGPGNSSFCFQQNAMLSHFESCWIILSYMGMGQNLWYHIWVDEPPFTIYFDVH